MRMREFVRILIPPRARTFLKKLAGNAPFVANFARLRQRIDQLETDVVALERRLERFEAHFYEPARALSDLEPARGPFDRIEYRDGTLTVSGWILLPGKEFDSAAIYLNQDKATEVSITRRDDVAKAFPFISHAGHSGFRFEIPRPADAMAGMVDICVVGISAGREIAKIETWFRTDLYSCLPAPPATLMLRENGYENASIHMLLGLQSYKEFWTTACKYADPASLKNMLDWGCGCGRVVGFFSKFSGIPEIRGCDIDAEAVEWCSGNLKPADFSVIPLHPPTSYPDNTFNLVISFSVLTHLSKDVQLTWLEEMKRILAPGGLFLATVQGEFAAMFSFAGRRIREILRNGIYDDMADAALDGVAPKGYYRSVFQTKEYTLREYSRHFEVLEYIEAGGTGFQDLLVMRKRD